MFESVETSIVVIWFPNNPNTSMLVQSVRSVRTDIEHAFAFNVVSAVQPVSVSPVRFGLFEQFADTKDADDGETSRVPVMSQKLQSSVTKDVHPVSVIAFKFVLLDTSKVTRELRPLQSRMPVMFDAFSCNVVRAEHVPRPLILVGGEV